MREGEGGRCETGGEGGVRQGVREGEGGEGGCGRVREGGVTHQVVTSTHRVLYGGNGDRLV